MAQTLIAWLSVLVAVVGAIIAFRNVNRSKWIMVLAGGFTLEACVLVFFRVGLMMATKGVFGGSSLGAMFLLASVVGLAARAAIVVGIGGFLAEKPRT